MQPTDEQRFLAIASEARRMNIGELQDAKSWGQLLRPTATRPMFDEFLASYPFPQQRGTIFQGVKFTVEREQPDEGDYIPLDRWTKYKFEGADWSFETEVRCGPSIKSRGPGLTGNRRVAAAWFSGLAAKTDTGMVSQFWNIASALSLVIVEPSYVSQVIEIDSGGEGRAEIRRVANDNGVWLFDNCEYAIIVGNVTAVTMVKLAA